MQDNKVNVICDEAIAQISKGDRDALSVIFDCMARMIFSVGIAITGNDADAEDVLQETMIEIVKYAHTYRSGSNARAWILSMARHRAIDIVRKRRPTVSIEDALSENIPDPQAEFSQTGVLELLNLLEDEEKQLVVFRLYEELPYAEIAEIMRISVAAAQKRYQRALKKLKKAYLS